MSKLEELARAAAGAAVLKSGVVMDEEVYEPIVRATLEALMEPTQEMVRAGTAAGMTAKVRRVTEDVWQAMISAILQEHEDGE